MEQHKQIQMYVGFAEGGCQDVATIKLDGFSLVDNNQLEALKALKAERDGLAAQVDVLLPLARQCLWGAFVWNDHNFGNLKGFCVAAAQGAGVTSLEEANELIAQTPAACLAQVRADAGRAGFIAGVECCSDYLDSYYADIDFTKHADAHTEAIRQGGA